MHLMLREGFQVYSTLWKEEFGYMELRFRLCPEAEVEWNNSRPFAVLQAALKVALEMAAYRVKGYDNPYVKEGVPEGKRALSINCCDPIWLLDQNTEPILDRETQSPRQARKQLMLEEDRVLA